LYFGLIVTPRYVSEARFVVRGVNTQRLGGLDALFRTFGISQASDDANIVKNYVLSRDAVRELQTMLDVKSMFGEPKADVLSRFPRPWESNTFEGLFEHYLSRVTLIQDPNRGVSVLSVQAFNAEDARKIASGLLDLAERLVNSLNERAHADALRSADAEMQFAEQRVIDAQIKLTEFRNAAILVDPAKSSNSTLDTITNLSNELASAEAQLREMATVAPSSPGQSVLSARIAALRGRIQIERGKLAGEAGSLAGKVSTYERLTLVRDLADKSLAASIASLESARAEARRQKIYIERLSIPQAPDEAMEPRRARSVLMVFLVGVMLNVVAWILSVGAKEHAA
jgi:capsular polysaccharide transport system permease protein